MPIPQNRVGKNPNKYIKYFGIASNARFFVCALMIGLQISGSIFGLGSVSISELLAIPAVHAAEGINQAVNYQGKLMDSTGNLVADGDYDMIFVLYDSAVAGNQLWSASTTNGLPTGTTSTISVTVTSGLFSILLGDVSDGQVAFPEGLFNNNNLYLGVTIGADSEMTPRKRLSAVPYAFNSETLQGQYASNTVANTGGDLFALHQGSSDAAAAARTVLYIETKGTSNLNDFLIRASDSISDVFSVSRQGNVTTTGNLVVEGDTELNNTLNVSATSTLADLSLNGRVNSNLLPYITDTYTLGNSTYRWLGVTAQNINAVNVSSTNIDALGYVSTTNLYSNTALLGNVTSTNLYNSGVVSTTSLYVNGVAITGAGATPTWQQVTDVGATTNDWIQFAGATSTNHFLPGTNNLFNLGSTAYRWANLFAVNGNFTGTVTTTNLFASGYVSTTNLYVNGTQITGATPTLQNVTDEGYITNDAIGFAGASSTGHLLPTANITYDLGSTSFRWRNLYASNGIFTNVSSTNIDALSYVSTTNVHASFGLLGNVTTTNLYNSGTVSTTQLYVNGTQITGSESQDLQDVTDLGAVTTNWLQFAGATTTANFVPTSTNLLSLGTSANRWSDLWSGAVHIGTSTWDLEQQANGSFTIGDGVERMRILTNGFVGINTSTPSARFAVTGAKALTTLDIASWDNSRSYFYVGATGQIGINTSTVNYTAAEVTVDGSMVSAQDAIHDLGHGDYRWRRLHSQYVRPNVLEMLSDARVEGNFIPATDLTYSLGTSTLRWLGLDVGFVSTTDVTINGYSVTPDDYFRQGGNMFGESAVLGTEDFYDLDIVTDGITRMTITDTGFVGIASSSPSAKFTLIGDKTLPTMHVRNFDDTDSLFFISKDGNVGIGDDTFTGNFLVEIDGHVGPSIDNTYDLGSLAYRWANLFSVDGNFSGTVTTTNIFASGYVSTTNLYVNGNQITGSAGTLQQVTDAGATTTNRIQFAGATSTAGIRLIGNLDNTLQASQSFGGSISTLLNTSITDLTVAGNYLYLATSEANSALYIFDISNKNNILAISTTTLAGMTNANRIFLAGNYVFAVDPNTELLAITDVSDVRTPVFVTSTHLGSGASAMDVVVSGQFAYVITGNGLVVLDVTNPAQPEIVQTTNDDGNSLTIQNGYLYVVDDNGAGNDQLHVVDISDPFAATVLTTLALGIDFDPTDIYVQGSYAYIIGVGGYATPELKVVDITDLSSLAVIDTTSLSAYGERLHASGRYLYTSNQQVFDIHTPSNPVEIFDNSNASTNAGIYSAGRYTYLAVNPWPSGDVLILDIGGTETNGLVAHNALLGSLQVLGDVKFMHQLSVDGGMHLGNGGLFAGGALAVTGTSTLSNLSLSGRVNSNLLPYITDTYSLGNSTYRWLGVTAQNISAVNVSSTNIDALGYVSTTNLFSGFGLLGNVTTTNLYNSGVVSTTALYVNGTQITGNGGASSLQQVTDVGNITNDWIEFAGGTSTDSLFIEGSADVPQLVVQENSTQSLANKLIEFRDSTGALLGGIHTNDATNIFTGIYSGDEITTGINNSFYGSESGEFVTTGEDNTAVGRYAMFGNYDDITGSYNTAIGSESMYGYGGDPISGSDNSGVGYQSLSSLTTGYSNSALGYHALRLTTTGYENTAVGSTVLASNLTGIKNVGMGFQALYNNATGSANISIGNESSYNNGGDENIAIGKNALFIGEWVDRSVAVGVDALFTNTVDENVAVGHRAVRANNTGARLTGVGKEAMVNNSTGSNNTAMGFESLYSNVSGSNNTAYGTYALYGTNANSFSNNTAIGYNSLYYVTTGSNNTTLGSGALSLLTSGASNTALGYNAGDNITTGSNNITIGSNINAISATGNNQLNIGNALYGNLSNGFLSVGTSTQTSLFNVAGTSRMRTILPETTLTYDLGSSSNRWRDVWASTTYIGTSTWQLKQDSAGAFTITNVNSGLDLVKIDNNGTLRPAANNTYYLGSNGYKWLGIEASNVTTTNLSVSGVVSTTELNVGGTQIFGGDGAGFQDGGPSTSTLGPELLTNPNFTSNLTGWTYNATYWSYNAGTAQWLTGISNSSPLSQNISTVAGRTYLLEVDVSYLNSIWLAITLTNATGEGCNQLNTGTTFCYFISSNTGSNTLSIESWPLTPSQANIDSVSIKLVNPTEPVVSALNNDGSNGGFAVRPGGSDLNNLFVGYDAGKNNMSGSYDTAYGINALGKIFNSSANTAIGFGALYSLRTGASNTALGYGADVTGISLSNSTAIGYNASVNASNKAVIGNNAVTTIGGYANWSNYSDVSIKENIEDYDVGLDFILNLRPRQFEMKAWDDRKVEGFIAQEVKTVMDLHGIPFSGYVDPVLDGGDPNDLKSLSYGQFVIPLVNAVQEIYASSSPLWNGIAINSEFASTTEPFMLVDENGNISYQGVAITAQNTATSSTPAFDSHTFSFMGSAWNSDTVQEITTSFDVFNNTISATSSELKFIYSTGTGFTQDLLTITNSGDVKVSGDLHVGRRLYLGSNTTGESSTSTYIFVDDTLSPTSTYIATNADGWQTESTYDYAERYESSDNLIPGDLVTVDSTGTNKVKRATSPSDPLMGIVSTKPGFVTGRHYDGWYPIALAGRVPTRVSTKNGTIAAGDYITASDIPGVGVKATNDSNVIGIALESYSSADEGLISVFVKSIGNNAQVETNTIVYGPEAPVSTIDIQKFAMIKAGEKEVTIKYASVGAFPMVQITPYGSVNGGYWVTDVSDTGFKIVLSESQTHDFLIAYEVKLPTANDVMLSDGTTAHIDNLTGQITYPAGSTESATENAESELYQEETSDVITDPLIQDETSIENTNLELSTGATSI